MNSRPRVDQCQLSPQTTPPTRELSSNRVDLWGPTHHPPRQLTLASARGAALTREKKRETPKKSKKKTKLKIEKNRERKQKNRRTHETNRKKTKKLKEKAKKIEKKKRPTHPIRPRELTLKNRFAAHPPQQLTAFFAISPPTPQS